MGRLLAWLMPYAWWVAAAAFAALLLALGAARLEVGTLRVEISDLKASWATERAASAEVARAKEAQNRAEEQRRAAAHQEALEHEQQQAAQARADLAIADAAAGRLRARVDALIAAARDAASNSQALPAGPAAEDPAGMLADVLGRCVARVRLLADVADERGRAGELCAAQYDALEPGITGP